MAFGLKYTLNFDDIHKTEPAKWTVNFYFDGYLGDSTELIGSGTPLIITKGERGQDKMAPIAGSKAEIEIIITDDTFDKTQFFIIQQFQIKVTITKTDFEGNGSFWWGGYVKPSYCEYPYAVAPYPFKIIATDGIALLKNNLVDLTEIKRGTGYVSILNLLMEKGVFETKHGLNNLRVISSLHRTGKTQTFDNISTRFELWVDDKGSYMNIYDILVQIATSFTGRIFFDAEYIWFQRIADLINPNPIVLQYFDSSEAPTEITLESNFFKILKGEISSSEMIYQNNDAFITIMSPYKQSLIDVDYKFRTWLQNGDWNYWNGSDFDNWQRFIVDGSGSDFHIERHGDGTEDLPYTAFLPKYSPSTAYISQYIDDVPNNAIIDLQFDAKFLNTSKFAFQIHLYNKDSGGVYHHMAYWDAAGFWALPFSGGTSPGGNDAHNMVSRNSDDQNISVSFQTKNMEFHFSDTPINSIQLLIIDPDGTYDDGEEETGVEISEIKLSLITNNYNGETYTNRTGKDYSKYNEIENYAILSDVGVNVANGLHYEGESLSQYWTSTDVPYAINNIQALSLYSTMNINSFPFEIMEGTFYSNKVRFLNTIQRAFGEFKLFMQLYDEYDVKHCEHKMTLAEIREVNGIQEGTTSNRKFKIKK